MTCMLDSYSVSRAPGRVETAVEKVVRTESEGERSLGARLRGGLDSSMLFLGSFMCVVRRADHDIEVLLCTMRAFSQLSPHIRRVPRPCRIRAKIWGETD